MSEVHPCGCSLAPSKDGTLVSPCAAHASDPQRMARMVATFEADQPQAPADSTYSGDPSASKRDQVRFRLGDVGPNFLLKDAEIDFLLLQQGSDTPSAITQGCYAIMARAAQLRDESVGSVSISWNQVFEHFNTMLTTLRRQSTVRGLPFAGGIRRSQKMLQRADSDRVKPSFIRDLFQVPDNPEEPLNGVYDPVTGSTGETYD